MAISPTVIPSYGTAGVNDNLFPVFTQSVFSPGNALGPTLYGYGQAPLATLPAGPGAPVYGAAGGGSGLSVGGTAPQVKPVYLAVMLAASFGIGVWILAKVHWGL